MATFVNILTIFNLIILASLLFFRKENSKPNKVLAFIILIPASAFTINLLLYTGILYNHSYLLLMLISYLWAPCILWYVHLLLGQNVKLTYKVFPHLLLQIICTSCLLLFYFQEASYKISFFDGVFHQRYPWQLVVYNSVLALQTFGYLIFSFIKIKTYVNTYESREGSINLTTLKIRWLKEFVLLLIAINVLVVLVSFFIPMEIVAYIVCPLGYSLFYILILYEAFRNSAVFSAFEFQQYVRTEKENKDKYINSSLKPSVIEEIYETLLTYLETQKPFLQADLSIKRLSSQINIPSHILSQIINQKFQKNFPDLINFYRIKEAKRKLEILKKSNLSIEGVGLECGFGSPSAFYKAFKKNTNLTPSEYIKEVSA